MEITVMEFFVYLVIIIILGFLVPWLQGENKRR